MDYRLGSKGIFFVLLVLGILASTISVVNDRSRNRDYYGKRSHQKHKKDDNVKGKSNPRRQHNRNLVKLRHGADNSLERSRWLPEWAAPWLRGSINLGGASVSFDSELGNFFNIDSNGWWKGPNVCINRTEYEEENDAQNPEVEHHHFGTFSYCDLSDTAYVCTTKVNYNGKKKVYSVVYECCHGFEREEGLSGCPKEMDLEDIIETSEEHGAGEYINALERMNLEDMINRDNYTLFAPLDDYFKEYIPNAKKIEMNVVVVSEEMETIAMSTRKMLLTHIVPGIIRSSKFSDELLLNTEDPQSKIRINIYNSPKKIVTANCVPLKSTDHYADNGVVHIVDGVLDPVQDSLMELIARDPKLTMLKTLVGKMGLSQLLKNSGEYTMFAPTNGAFKKLKISLLERLKEGSNCLVDLIKNHILNHVVCSSAIDTKARTRNMIDNYLNLTKTEEAKYYINSAQVISRDIMATNGVLYLIDEVLIPEDALDVLDVAEKRGATEFLKLVEAAGMKKTLERTENFTLFIPTNEAIQNLPDSLKKEIEENPVVLENILKYHISPEGEVNCHHLHTNLQLPTMIPDKNILIKEYYSVPFGHNHKRVAQCAPIVETDISSCNGVAHMTERVLIPPKGNVLDVLAQTPNYSMVLDLMKVAGLSDEIQGKGPFTYFAPTNQALTNLNQQELSNLRNNPDRLKGFLKSHIIQATLCCSGIFNNPWFWRQNEWTLDSSQLHLSQRHENHFLINRKTPIAECDITATNGVIHGINSVLDSAWEKYVVQAEAHSSMEGQNQLHKMMGSHWDDVWENMREWNWMGRGWRSGK